MLLLSCAIVLLMFILPSEIFSMYLKLIFLSLSDFLFILFFIFLKCCSLLCDCLWFQLSKRGESVEEKIKKLDVELARYGEQIRKTRPGHSQDSLKNRAMRILKQKRM